MSKFKVDLQGVSETMLIPLWAKAQESQRRDGMIRDDKAVSMVEAMDYDFSIFGGYQDFYRTQVGTAARTLILDKAVQGFIDAHPRGTIVNLGAGLDTRISRMNLQEVLWVDIDLEDAINLRRCFYKPSDRHLFIAGSVLKDGWEVLLPKTEVLFIAEGLFMYFSLTDIEGLFQRIHNHFEGPKLIFEAMDPFVIGQSKKHESVKKMAHQVEFLSGFRDAKDVEALVPDLEVLDTWYHMDYGGDRWLSEEDMKYKKMSKIFSVAFK